MYAQVSGYFHSPNTFRVGWLESQTCIGVNEVISLYVLTSNRRHIYPAEIAQRDTSNINYVAASLSFNMS